MPAQPLCPTHCPSKQLMPFLCCQDGCWSLLIEACDLAARWVEELDLFYVLFCSWGPVGLLRWEGEASLQLQVKG